MSKRTDLYRHYDAFGRLLYVGISLSAAVRLSQHRASPWYDEIARIEIQKFATRGEAEVAEMIAIAEEQPRYNVVRLDALSPEMEARFERLKGRAKMPTRDECPDKYIKPMGGYWWGSNDGKEWRDTGIKVEMRAETVE